MSRKKGNKKNFRKGRKISMEEIFKIRKAAEDKKSIFEKIYDKTRGIEF